MDWLSHYYVVLHFFAKTITLAMPCICLVVWKGSFSHMPSGVISYVRAQRLLSSGCLDYLTYVQDVSREEPKVNSTPVVREFVNVFPTNLPNLPSDHDINFSIDLESVTHPISILSYYMAPAKLKEQGVQL